MGRDNLFVKFVSLLAVAPVFASCFFCGISARAEFVDMGIDSDAWTAVDGLGRTITSYDDAPESKDRQVGIFYWTWHSAFKSHNPLNLTEVIRQYPEAKNRYNHRVWRESGRFMGFWDEPLFGYYSSTDKYVLRKHAEMLADAGVDVMIFDCTNASDNDYNENIRRTWEEGYLALFETLLEAREDGVDTPDVAFMLPFGATDGSRDMLNILYDRVYSKGLYKELWYYYDDKPLIMAHRDNLNLENTEEKEIYVFFTFKKNDSSYFSNDTEDAWGWLSIYPQAKYGKIGSDGRPEQMTVGVAQNANETAITAMNGYNVLGRGKSVGDYTYSYQYKNETITVSKNTENAHYYGINFQQQFDYAIECDPDFLFITGWNEWVAERQKMWPATGPYAVQNGFPDQFTSEYSRDIEPTSGELKDNYYCQLVSNIRRFKGMDNCVPKMSKKTIDIDDVSSWDSVSSSYNHYANSTYNRNEKGYGNKLYTNYTMRNDIVHTKFAYDDDNVYFYVETKDVLSPYTDNAWMRLFIDTDSSGISPNWEGFEFVVNRLSPDSTKCTLEKSNGISSNGDWLWNTVGQVDYTVFENVLQIQIPREMLGLNSKSVQFNFKWSDNMQDEGNILDFYSSGDVAPGGRFMFIATSNDNINGTSILDIIVISLIVFITGMIAIFMMIKNKKEH